MTGGEPRTFGRRGPGRFAVAKASGDWTFTAVAMLLALLPRLYAAIAWAREPVWDGHYYHFGAQRIAAGLGYSEDVIVNGQPVWKPWCHYPVGYSALLGGVYKLFGSSLIVAPLVNVVIGVLTVMVAHRVARFYLSVARARCAALLVALHPGLIVYSALLMTEPLAALSLLLGLWFALSLPGRWAWIVSGATLGLGALVRPPSLLVIPLFVLVFGSPLRDALKKTVLCGCCALLVILPWTYRNCRVMDGCALVSTNGGWNLAIGALRSSGRFDSLHPDDGCKIVSGQVQQDRCWAEIGMRAIARDPGHWLGLIPKKLEHTYNHESFAIAYLREANPGFWDDQRRDQGRAVLTLFHHVLVLVACLSIVARVAWRTRKWREIVAQGGLVLGLVGFIAYALRYDPPPLFWLPVALPLLASLPLPGAPSQGPVGRYCLGALFATSFTTALFFGEDRYHLVVSPLLCILAAAALRPTGQGSAEETQIADAAC